MALEEQKFERMAAQVLSRIAARLEEFDVLDVELHEGVLTIETELGKTFVLNKHAPLRQLWLSSPVSGASHYNFDEATGAWSGTRGGGPLAATLATDLAAAAGVTIDFRQDVSLA